MPPTDELQGDEVGVARRDAAYLRVAVLGMGSIGMRHYGLLAGRCDAEAIAVPARAGRVEALRGRGIRAAHDLEEAVAWGARSVIVATDTGRHEADAMEAIAKGLDVLVEKPLATNAESAERVSMAARSAGVRLRVASCLRFDPGLDWVRLRLGRIGGISEAHVECSSWLPDWRPERPYQKSYASRPGEGGVLLDLIHEIDYAAWLFGALEVIEAELSNSGVLGLPGEVEDNALVRARARAVKSPIVIRLSYASRTEARFLNVAGSAGQLDWDFRTGTARLSSAAGSTVDSMAWDPAGMYEAQLGAWLDELRGRPDSRMSTAEEGVDALKVCDVARELSRARVGQS